ncbi:hypothetical protein ACFFRR_008071 [Megaselia abdita]
MASRFALNFDQENNVPCKYKNITKKKKNIKIIFPRIAVKQNGKMETIFDRPAKKEAFSEVNKNTLHNQAPVNLKSNDKFVIQSKENIISQKREEKEDPFEIDSYCAASCKKSCHTDPSILWAENALKNFDMQKEIENAEKIDDFAGEMELMLNRIQKGMDQEKVTIFEDYKKKLAKDDHLKDLFNDLSSLLVLPESEEPKPMNTIKPKQNKFQVFEDDDVPAFVPNKNKRAKRAFALRRL